MQTLPYGSWPSPLDARATLAGVTRRSSPRADGSDLYWLEARPQDAGKVTLVRRSADGSRHDVSPPEHNVRSRYLEYGGGDFVAADGLALWVDFGSQRVWLGGLGQEPRPLTPETGGAVRWSCFRLDLTRRAVFCLREDQRDADLEPVNSLVRLDLDTGNDDLGAVLVAGKERRVVDRDSGHGSAGPDFLLDPALSPNGGRLAWLAWDHPNMSWHETTLWLGTLDEKGDLHDAHPVAGGDGESWEQPSWLDDTTVLVLGDATGWSNLYRLDVEDEQVRPVTDDQCELGMPRWVPDLRSYAVLDGTRVVSGRSKDGFRELVVIDIDMETAAVTEVATDTSYIGDIAVLDDGRIAVGAAFTDAAADILLVDPASGVTEQATDGHGPGVPTWLASTPEPVSWPTPDGAIAHGFLYRPHHPEVQAPEGDLPPLIVTLHGGPTGSTVPAFAASRTYWTSRGFAVLDVNYGGSTGYGRAYRERLDGQWGVVDVQDAASGAQHLADAGIVDPARLAITGGSAGGFTTLAAATFTDTFAAGASHFGVSDLAALATDTHKLESRYCDGLVAPWPSGEAVYRERSPIHHVEQLSTPLILLQGTDDRVVPPDQAEKMAQALREKGLPVALVLFEGEGHGFRALDNQVRALEAELSFYAQVFGIELAEQIEPVPVENLG